MNAINLPTLQYLTAHRMINMLLDFSPQHRAAYQRSVMLDPQFPAPTRTHLALPREYPAVQRTLNITEQDAYNASFPINDANCCNA